MNVREHWRQRSARVKRERWATHLALVGQVKPMLPCTICLTRIGPSNGLDPFDNLPSSLKGVADQIAEWLGVDDRHSAMVRYVCAQRRGRQWCVQVTAHPEWHIAA